MTGLHIVGLGSGDENQLTLGVWNKLKSASKLYVRTEKHPVIETLLQGKIAYESFDSLYENNNTFEGVYEAIVDALITKVKEGGSDIIYAVPGHPMVAEYTVKLLRERCPEEGIPLTVSGGESFLDQAFLRFGFDPIEGFQLLDASDVKPSHLNMRLHTVIGQVYDVHTASDAKLGLMEIYPDDYPVVVGHALGVEGMEEIHEVALYELDRVSGFGNLSLIWVPRSEDVNQQNRSFSRLHEVIATLRSPEGCPWDREQTHASLRKYLLEETYEVIETIDDDDPDAMADELGDLLLQIMLHSQIEEETGMFSVYDVIQGLNEKMIRRHPHVFGDQTADNSDEVLANWQEIKNQEKRDKGIEVDKESILSGIPKSLPALLRAVKLQKKAAKVGFDWDKLEDVFAKVEEEIAELKEVLYSENHREEREEELGDLLFALVNLSRFLKADPEEALSAANRKFTQRFSYIEEQLRLREKDFAQTDLIEMENLWQEAKKLKKRT